MSSANPPIHTGRNVVMMMEQGWPGLYMANELASQGLLSAVITQKEACDSARWSVQGMLRSGRRVGWQYAVPAFFGFRHGLGYAARRLRDRRVHPQLEDLRRSGVQLHRVAAFLSDECHELLRRLAPDVTVICGTPILPDSLLSIARLCTLNTHTSLLPHYRGGGSFFWPLFFRDTEKVGFTIHKAVAQVDAGPYLHQEAIPVRPDDTPRTLTHKAFVRATEVIAEILRTSPLDETAWKQYEKPLRYSWRGPDAMVRRYHFGPTLKQRVAPAVQGIAKAMKLKPQPGIATFYFHRALDNRTPATDWRRIMGHETVSELRQKLLYLKRNFEIIPVTKALELMDRGEPLKQSYAVITVDDGYRDFRTQFLPLAEELGVPATLFVCSGAIRTGTVWFQRAYDLIFRIDGDRLYLPWADRKVYFGDAQHRVLTIERVILPYLKRLSRTLRAERLGSLLRHNPVDPVPDAQDAFCSERDLLELKASRLIELHPHSHHHDPYETLTEEELVADVTECRRFFSETLGIDSTVMSYPNGRTKPEYAAVLNRLGIKHAFTTAIGLEHPSKTQPYAIRRTGMDGSMAQFHWNVRRVLQT
jgi:folate-dependent phosphoribosylglycinamide formyltransferase PurN/peptidoglycan/xylan/chitin deacetylase (PgdA/CDA1 family)